MNNIFKLVDEEISGRQAWRYADRIAQYNRIQASPGYRDSAIQIISMLAKEGVEARIEDFPAQRDLRFLGRASFQEWRCRSGELWLLQQDGKRRLSRYQEQELSLVQRSAATPPGGVEAQLVYVPNADNPESYNNLDLKGKIALVRGNPNTIHALAVEQHGASGLVFDNLNNYPPLRTRADMPDAIQYTSFWWSGRETETFGFCVSPRIGDELRELLKKGEVKLLAQVDAQLVDGTFENVEYFIPGKKEQEILLVAHLCHPYPGAQDNASGPAVLMEVARTLKRLMDNGSLEQPELGIRFIMVPEMTGTFAYFHRHPQRRELTVAALNLDMVGAAQDKGGGPLCVEQPPLSTPTFVDRYAYGILDSFSRDVGNFTGTYRYSTCHYLPTRFSGGSDHYVISDPSIGIPCPMIIQWPDKSYHTSMDHPGNLDPAMLKRVGIVTSLYAWGLANGTESEWLEFLIRDVDSRRDYLRKILEWAFANENLKSNWREVLDFYQDYELKAIEQLSAYGKIRGFDTLVEKTVWARDHLISAAASLREWALQRASLSGEAKIAEQKLCPEMANTVYARVYSGPSNLANELTLLPIPRRLEWTKFAKENRVATGYSTSLEYWIDGERPLGEVLELVKLETGAWNPDYAVKYLELCEELGILRVIG